MDRRSYYEELNYDKVTNKFGEHPSSTMQYVYKKFKKEKLPIINENSALPALQRSFASRASSFVTILRMVNAQFEAVLGLSTNKSSVLN